MFQLTTNKPSTVTVHFTEQLPKMFCLYDDRGRTYYFRYLNGKTPRIKFNIPDSGTFHTDTPFRLYKMTSIETPPSYPILPPAERDRWKDVQVVVNPELDGTPARIFSDTGVIEVSNSFSSFPPPVRLFLLLHETGHMLYKSEEYCDLWALINFLKMGYNRSTAYYTLDKILSRSQENIERIKFLLTQITANTGQDLNKKI